MRGATALPALAAGSSLWCGDVPVLAGVCGTDPFRIMGNFLGQL